MKDVSMDFIRLTDIELWTHIGVPEAERATAQRVLVSIELQHSLKNVGTTDDVTLGIDYADVTAKIVELGKKERKTIECLAEDIATMLIQDVRPDNGVTVTVTKNPVLPLSSASVSITRP